MLEVQNNGGTDVTESMILFLGFKFGTAVLLYEPKAVLGLFCL